MSIGNHAVPVCNGSINVGQCVPFGALHGLNVVAGAVIAQALYGMARNLCTDTASITIATVSACTQSRPVCNHWNQWQVFSWFIAYY